MAYGSPAAFTAVLTTSWTIPGTASTVASVGGAALDQSTVAFPAFASNPAIGGIYRWSGGTISVVADHTTPIPGGSGLFNNFGETDIHSGIVAVAGRGAGGQSGVYLGHPSGTLQRLYDTNTPVPGGGSFTTFSDLSTEAGRVAFRGISPGFVGVYSDVSGTLEQLVRSGDPVPGVPGGVFSEFSGLALDGGYLAFGGSFGGAFLGSGIFTDYGGTLSKIIATGDPLDGRVVDSIVFSRESHSGNQIAFAVLFTDGWRGVYMATIPAPGAALMLSLSISGVASRRRRPVAAANGSIPPD